MSEKDLSSKLKSYLWPGALIALLGFGGLFAGLAADPTTGWQSYLYGWYFWASVSIGCFAITLLHHTLRASWGLSVLRFAEAGGGPEALAATALGFVPILLNLGKVYSWVDHPIALKTWWLNPTGFTIRFVIYFVVFIALAAMLRKSSRQQDENLDPKLGVKRHTWGPVGLVIFFVLMTFAVTDWVMSLEPHFMSAIMPLFNAVAMGLSGLSLLVILVLVNRNSEPFKGAVTPQLTKDLGNMLFATTLVWQYLSLSQYLIIYAGNLPEEAPYFLKRNDNGWAMVIGAIVFFQFFVPFLALMAPRVKRYASSLLAVAILIFAVRFFDIHWQILPALRCLGDAPQTPLQSFTHWQDYAALAAFGGLWFAIFGSQVGKSALLPKHDTRLLEVEHAH